MAITVMYEAARLGRLVGLVVKAFASRVADPGSIPVCAVGIFPGRVVQVTSKLALQAPGIIGSALGLVSPVSVYCDRVR